MALQMLVMQHRCMRVVSNDVVVGQLLFAQDAGFQITHVRLILGGARSEGGQCGRVTTRRQGACPAHAFQLVGGLHGTVVMEPGEQIGVIDGSALGEAATSLRADERHASQVPPALDGGLRIVGRNQVDRSCPRGLGDRRGLVPVIVGLMKQHLERPSRCVHQYGSWAVENGHPGLEVRIDLVWVVLVIEKLQGWTSRMNHQRVEAGGGQRGIRGLHQRLQMGGVEFVELVHHPSSQACFTASKYAPVVGRRVGQRGCPWRIRTLHDARIGESDMKVRRNPLKSAQSFGWKSWTTRSALPFYHQIFLGYR